MRIVFVTTFPSAESGGAGRVAHELAVATAGRHEVTLVCSGDRTELCRLGENLPEVVRVATRGIGDIRLPDLRGRRWLEALLDNLQPDIVHAHDFSILSLWFQDWAWRCGRPFVVTLHCLPSQAEAFSAEEKSPFLQVLAQSPLFRLFIRLYLGRCSGVIALNEAMERDLRRFGYRGPLYRVPNGRELGVYASLPTADPTQPEKRLLFVGALARRKNQRYLLEMMENLEVPARLVLVGEPAERGYLNELGSFIAARGLRNVDIVGAVPHSAIPRHLQSAHVFVSASRLEVQSLAVIEALASGTPVVGLANQTVDELVDEAVGRRLPADASPAEFGRAVTEVCTLAPKDYAAMCQAARARVQSLDWQSVVQANEAVYKDLIARCAEAGVRNGRTSLWTPWLVAASSLRYGWRDLTHPTQDRRQRRRPAWLGGTGRRLP